MSSSRNSYNVEELRNVSKRVGGDPLFKPRDGENLQGNGSSIKWSSKNPWAGSIL